MRSVFEFILYLASSIYQAILKLSINAHQLIAHWRNRINRGQISTHNSSFGPGPEQSDCINQPRVDEYQLLQPGDTSDSVSKQSTGLSSEATSSSKTPHSRRFKIYSILRRLSVRNFMEYCVIALNEASSSSCSNKFDLTTCDRPVWLLGHRYELPQDASDLVNDIKSKIWITYRRNFPPIDDGLRYTTDRGFGCMIRCGQMVLANALLYKRLGRDWRWSENGLEANPDSYITILKLFQDKEESPYSIHNIVRSGQHEGKNVGEWFGPNTIAQALKRITVARNSHLSSETELLISVDAALDNVVVIDEIKSRFKCMNSKLGNESNFETVSDKMRGDDHATENPKVHDWIPGVLFIQLRLGLTKINPLYFNALRKTFKFKNSLGIIGGRPNHALYLIGYTDDDIIYLDPHSTQQFVDLDTGIIGEGSPEDLRSLPLDSTYHCASPEKMSIDRLDPSLALCFYFHDEQSFDDWSEQSTDLLIKSEQAPMFEITATRPTDWDVPLDSTSVRIDQKSLAAKDKKSRGIGLVDNNILDEASIDCERADFNEENFEELDSKLPDKNTSEKSQTNDDEEFEMLG